MTGGKERRDRGGKGRQAREEDASIGKPRSSDKGGSWLSPQLGSGKEDEKRSPLVTKGKLAGRD